MQVSILADATDIVYDDFQKIHEINVHGPFLLAHALEKND